MGKIIDGCLIHEDINSEIILLLTLSYDYLLYLKCESVTTQVSLMVIQVPQTFWRPKMQNRYIPPDYENEIDKGVIYFQQYRRALYRLKKLGKKLVVQI